MLAMLRKALAAISALDLALGALLAGAVMAAQAAAAPLCYVWRRDRRERWAHLDA